MLTVWAVQAQTVQWQLPLSDYSSITRINYNLYKAEKNNKIGLIRADGSVVAPIENDAIGDFYENKALVTLNDGHGERVMGCLTEEGKFYPYSKKFYTLAGQKFFSDGALSVSDEEGRLGYIDMLGNVIVGFDGKYSKIKPFVEGYAAVFKGNKFNLIDKNGIGVRFKFGTVAELFGGTNACNGLVYVWDTNGKFYTYNINQGGECKKAKAPKSDKLDYLYRFSEISGLTKEVPFKKSAAQGTIGLSAKAQDGLYGYESGAITVLPYQLQSASNFEDGYAVVGMNGRLGILRYVEGGSFDASSLTPEQSFYAGREVDCKFRLSIPSSWHDKSLDIVLRDANGFTIQTTQLADNYSFSVKPTDTTTENFQLGVYADGLKLYGTEIAYTFNKRELCPICGKDKTVCPGHPTEGSQKEEEQQEILCPTCGKPITECRYQGVH